MSFLTFEKQDRKINQTTDIYLVQNKSKGVDLGIISFYPQFRAYVIKPLPTTLFDSKCLEEISVFLKSITNDWRKEVRRWSKF